MRKTKFITDLNQFYGFILNQSLEVKDFHILNEELIQLEYNMKTDLLEQEQITNINVATFTTCWARLRLYQVLDQLKDRCLYYDTDSVIYLDDGSVNLPLGDYLGDLTDELPPGRHIVRYLSGGPKNYAYILDDGSETVKVRGFSLNYKNSGVINFASIKELLGNRDAHLTVSDPQDIVRAKYTQQILSVRQDKRYHIVYTKRRILPDMNTVPYGC